MFVTKYFQVINLTVPSTWIALVFAFIVAYILIRVKYGKTTASLLGDAMFYFVIVWKLSVILTDFKVVLQFPLSILYFNGGAVGVYLGIVAIGIFLFITLKKNGLSRVDRFGLLMSSLVILSSYQVFFAFLNAGPLSIRLMTVVVFFIFIFLVVLFEKRFREVPRELAMLMIGVHLFMSVLQPAGLFQTSTIAAVIIGVFLIIIHNQNYQMEAK